MTKKSHEELDALKEAFIASFDLTGPRILVEVARPKTDELSSILHIPDEVRKQDRHAMVTGKVRAMGGTCYNLASHTNPDTGKREKWCAVGDTVLFSQYAGSRILEEGCEFLYVMNDEDIQGRKRGSK
jgi:co-chaperonin GroES (HSP10)